MCEIPDVTIRYEGSIFLFNPLTDEGKNWIAEHVEEDAPRFGPALAVESNYAASLMLGMEEDGLRLRVI